MEIIFKPYYTGLKLTMATYVVFEEIPSDASIIAVTLKLTSPSHVTSIIADNEIYRVSEHIVSCHYFIDLPLALTGQYIITATAFSNGKFIGIKRDSFEIESSKDDFYIIRAPQLCWRTENDTTVSIFNVNGNLLFLKGRLKNIWDHADGMLCGVALLAQKTGLEITEIKELVALLEQKKVLVVRNKIKVIVRGTVYEFN